MPQTTYNISLKGYVGCADFGRTTIDDVLAKHSGKQINALIDSLGAAHISIDANAIYLNHK